MIELMSPETLKRILCGLGGGILGAMIVAIGGSSPHTALESGCEQPEAFVSVTQGRYRNEYLGTGRSGCAWVKRGAERCWERVAECDAHWENGEIGK